MKRKLISVISIIVIFALINILLYGVQYLYHFKDIAKIKTLDIQLKDEKKIIDSEKESLTKFQYDIGQLGKTIKEDEENKDQSKIWDNNVYKFTYQTDTDLYNKTLDNYNEKINNYNKDVDTYNSLIKNCNFYYIIPMPVPKFNKAIELK